MKIGMMIYSQTGNTLLVAERIENRLKAIGQDISIEKIQIENEKTPTKLSVAPSHKPYDFIIFAAPVQAFGLAPAMKTYLQQMELLNGKPVFGFVTQHFKKSWLGGNSALKKMRQLCQLKEGKLVHTEDIHWSSGNRDQEIEALIQAIEKCVTESFGG